MKWFRASDKTKMEDNFPWKFIYTTEELEKLISDSSEEVMLFFKHSPRCFISKMVKNNFEKDAERESCSFYLIDVLEQRKLSDKLAELLKIEHQSPQALVIRNKLLLYNESHNSINYMEIKKQIT